MQMPGIQDLYSNLAISRRVDPQAGSERYTLIERLTPKICKDPTREISPEELSKLREQCYEKKPGSSKRKADSTIVIPEDVIMSLKERCQ